MYRPQLFGAYGVHFAGPFGDTRADIIGMLTPFVGAAKATAAIDGFTKLIEDKAAAGASKKLKPLIIGLAAASGVAFLTGILAIVVAKRK